MTGKRPITLKTFHLCIARYDFSSGPYFSHLFTCTSLHPGTIARRSPQRSAQITVQA